MSACCSVSGSPIDDPLEWQQAYLLHRRPWRETSLWLEAFTREFGKVALLAKGVRRGKRSVSLEPLQPLLIRWRKKGELGTLLGAECIGPSLSLQGKALFCGFYLNELLSRLLAREDPHPALYDAYCHTLTGLAEDTDPASWLRRFELRLLEEIGYAPILDREIEYGADIVADLRYRYVPERGPAVDPKGWLHGQTLLNLAAGKLQTQPQQLEAKRLLRLLIDQQLQGRPLKSRLLFRQQSGKT